MTNPEPNPVVARLQSLGVTDETLIAAIQENLGVTTESDLSALTETDLVGIGMKPVPARNLLAGIAPPVDTSSAANMAASGIFADQLLPVVPEDASWLKSLQAGGILKVDQSSVIAAIRAALAAKVNLFELPKVLVKAMETFADANEEQVTEEYFAIRKMLVRRNYGDIFAAIDGLDGNYVTAERTNMFLTRVEDYMWPAITGFYLLLKNWQESWAQGAGTQLMMVHMMSTMAGGGGALPPGIGAIPDTGGLRDSAATVNDAINKAFAGPGTPIAAALAYQAKEIREVLENKRLPALIGATGRDQMLKQLKVSVPPTYPRLETNLTRFVLGVLQANEQSGGNEEAQYFGALYMLGAQIDWTQLGITSGELRGIGERL